MGSKGDCTRPNDVEAVGFGFISTIVAAA